MNENLINNLVTEMEEMLKERGISYTHNALYTLVTKALEAKKELIEILSKHPLWNPEKLMIQFDTDLTREIDCRAVSNFAYYLSRNTKSEWSWDGGNREYKITHNFITGVNSQYLNEDMKEAIDEVNSLNENFKIKINMKSSRAILKICKEEGWDKITDFNREYALVADALNPLKITRHTVISVNPIDFLLMSNGNSWTSCHYIGDIDEEPGCYSSGTVSYMLDNHSFLYYTVDASYDGNEIELEPKIHRQVFGYNDEVLAQLRLYPQSCDCGAETAYAEIRATVQKVIADCLGRNNLWTLKKNTSGIIKKGDGATCYPDWSNGNPGSSHCSVSTLKERENGTEDRTIVFGARPICVYCGYVHSVDGSIDCCNSYEDGYEYCETCGCREYYEDMYYIDGEYYCSDCVEYCDECNEYRPSREITKVGELSVCDHCLEHSGNYVRCSECDDWCHTDDIYYDEDGYPYCYYCKDRCLVECAECEELIRKENAVYDEITDNYFCESCYDCLLEQREDAEKKSVKDTALLDSWTKSIYIAV